MRKGSLELEGSLRRLTLEANQSIQNMKKTSLKTSILLAIAGLAFVSSVASAAVTTYTAGNLLMGFRQAGATNSLIVNLGPAATFKNATTGFVASSIPASELSTAFGANWYTDSTVTWAVIGAVAGSTVNGDSARTLYASSQEATYGTANDPYATSSVPSQSGPSTKVATAGGVYNGVENGTNVSLSQSNATTNSWNSFMTTGQFGYDSVWSLEGTVGAGSQLDLFRMQPNVTGTYEGSFTMSNAGVVSFSTSPVAAIPEPSRALLMGLGVAGIFLRRRRR